MRAVHAGVDDVSKLWMTDVTLQGDGDGVRDCDACGLSSWARVYAEGAHQRSAARYSQKELFLIFWECGSSALGLRRVWRAGWRVTVRCSTARYP